MFKNVPVRAILNLCKGNNGHNVNDLVQILRPKRMHVSWLNQFYTHCTALIMNSFYVITAKVYTQETRFVNDVKLLFILSLTFFGKPNRNTN